MKKIRNSVIFFVLLIALGGCNVPVTIIKVEPRAADITLLNPGRGFTTTGNTFNETMGNRLHPLSGIHQARWYWDMLEPEEGKINFAMIDSLLDKVARNGEQLNFRVMCQNFDMIIPSWAIKQGIKPPYYDNPVFLEKQGNLIKALAERYDGHPDLAFVDIGTVGQWGEWHSEENTKVKMPSDENVKKIIDIYLRNFTKTPLAMLIGGGVGLQYAVENGTGWRADCWGDMGEKWNHMGVRYPRAFETSNIGEGWKRGPIALETCWTIDKWFEEGWDIDYILSKALEWHTTSVNNGSYAVPKEWWPKIQEFEKKLGYRFALREFTYPSSVKNGELMKYTMKWENCGVAPIYKQYPLAFNLCAVSDSTKSWIIVANEDIKHWMPGITDINTELKMPDNIPSGKYEISVGLISPVTNKPVISLAIEGKGSEGWYKMGEILIDN
jgi:hypothetical protein